MDYSSVPKDDFLPAAKANPEANHGSHRKSKKFTCCCCKCTKGRFLKICCLATLGPIILIGAIIGIYLLVQRLSYNPGVTQISSANDTLAFLNELQQLAANSSSTNVTSEWRSDFRFLADLNPPWSDCSTSNNALGIPRVVKMSECTLEDSRCAIQMEKDWTLEIAFTMHPNVTVASPIFLSCGKAVYLGTPCRSQPFKHPNVCNSTNLDCPLEGGKSYLFRNTGGVYQANLPVKVLFDTYTDVYLRLRDPVIKKDIFCVRIPAIIKVK